MWPDRVSNPGPLTYEPGALPTALRGPAVFCIKLSLHHFVISCQHMTFTDFYQNIRSVNKLTVNEVTFEAWQLSIQEAK